LAEVGRMGGEDARSKFLESGFETLDTFLVVLGPCDTQNWVSFVGQDVTRTYIGTVILGICLLEV